MGSECIVLISAAIRLCITMKASIYFTILPREQGNTVLHIPYMSVVQGDLSFFDLQITD